MSYLANSPSNNYFFPLACNVERHDKFAAAADGEALQQCIFSALMIKDFCFRVMRRQRQNVNQLMMCMLLGVPNYVAWERRLNGFSCKWVHFFLAVDVIIFSKYFEY